MGEVVTMELNLDAFFFCLQPEAWETANVILSSADAPAEPKLFAAQTFRAKASCIIFIDPGQARPGTLGRAASGGTRQASSYR